MGYYTRILSNSEQCVSIDILSEEINLHNLPCQLEIDAEDSNLWASIILKLKDGSEIAIIERNPVESGSLGEEEINEFIEEIVNEKPASGSNWLKTYLPHIRTVYAFQHLSAANSDLGFKCLSTIRDKIWSSAPAILQADYEGFTNEDGYHILWQFSEKVTGKWAMAILKDTQWVNFEMDLGNKKHREAFKSGIVPAGVKLL
jgi:hypothetical protein